MYSLEDSGGRPGIDVASDDAKLGSGDGMVSPRLVTVAVPGLAEPALDAFVGAADDNVGIAVPELESNVVDVGRSILGIGSPLEPLGVTEGKGGMPKLFANDVVVDGKPFAPLPSNDDTGNPAANDVLRGVPGFGLVRGSPAGVVRTGISVVAVDAPLARFGRPGAAGVDAGGVGSGFPPRMGSPSPTPAAPVGGRGGRPRPPAGRGGSPSPSAETGSAVADVLDAVTPGRAANGAVALDVLDTEGVAALELVATTAAIGPLGVDTAAAPADAVGRVDDVASVLAVDIVALVVVGSAAAEVDALAAGSGGTPPAADPAGFAWVVFTSAFPAAKQTETVGTMDGVARGGIEDCCNVFPLVVSPAVETVGACGITRASGGRPLFPPGKDKPVLGAALAATAVDDGAAAGGGTVDDTVTEVVAWLVAPCDEGMLCVEVVVADTGS